MHFKEVGKVNVIAPSVSTVIYFPTQILLIQDCKSTFSSGISYTCVICAIYLSSYIKINFCITGTFLKGILKGTPTPYFVGIICYVTCTTVDLYSHRYVFIPRYG